jgi:DNA-directed RNA polymerase subunit RPC12/RpoP
MANTGFIYFCAVCLDNFEAHPVEMDRHTAKGICPRCGSENRVSYANPENPTEDMLTLEHYNKINGLDNNES